VVASGNPEQIDWQKVKDSAAASDVEQFLQKYPSGAFSGAAQAKLEDLYWNSAVGGNSAASYNQYLEKFPQGKHAQQAQTQIAGLEWRAVENSNDIAALETFLKKHPSGSDHDKALSRIDDLSWQKVKQNDASSLRSYLQSFPSGRHDTEANKKIEELSAATPVAPATKAPPAAPVVSDEKSAILDVVSRYKRAYEAKDIQSLQQIWPSMTSQQTRGVGDFFAHASELSLEVRVLGTPTIDGDRASATFEQSLRYMVNGKSRKDVARVVMNLKRAAPGVWHIDSIR
jgi:hypothetical protein